MLRSAFVSLFWGVISYRKKKDGFTLLALAKLLGANKGEVSRWFTGDPNWTVNTVANISNALGLQLHISATDKDGNVFTAAGLQKPVSPQITFPLNEGKTEIEEGSVEAIVTVPNGIEFERKVSIQ